jgi:subtilisin family serine protease
MPTKLIAPLDVAEPTATGDAWGIAAVGADTTAFTGVGTVVAVLDTGIDKAHPAFAGVTLVEQDFTGSGNGDAHGHGTHCAGTILGRDVGGVRIGIARGVDKALIGKVLGPDGGGSAMLFDGINWALAQGADVISMSLGFDFPGYVAEQVAQGFPADLATSEALEAYRANLRVLDALMAQGRALEAFGTGAVIAAAAGNESRRNEDKRFEIAVSIPAAAEGIVSVGALNRTAAGFDVAYFSNTFPQISGPGVGIVSAKAGTTTTVAMSGTSMACPHVAGVAALWWEAVRASTVPPSPRVVLAKLLANARLSGFAPAVDPVDRGAGIVAAP